MQNFNPNVVQFTRQLYLKQNNERKKLQSMNKMYKISILIKYVSITSSGVSGNK